MNKFFEKFVSRDNESKLEFGIGDMSRCRFFGCDRVLQIKIL